MISDMKKAFCLLLVLLFCRPGPAALSENAAGAGLPSCSYTSVTVTGSAESFVTYPQFTAGDDENAAVVAERLNGFIQEQALIPAYLQLLAGIQEDGTGLQFDYASSRSGAPFVSFLFSAKGKMLSGRPSQVYYPMTLNLETGESVPFEALFTDPDAAKARIEHTLEEEVEPALSSYLENSRLFPVPYDRFYLDGKGSLVLCYENSQLSFLSGCAGTVAFRYSELWEALDTSPDSVCMQVLKNGLQYAPHPELSFAQLLEAWTNEASLGGFGMDDLSLGMPLDEVFARFRPAADSEYYPGGACLEAEEGTLRGALLLTNEDETLLTGILSRRADCFGIETGKTALKDAEAIIGREPASRLPMNEAAAEIYRVCPGSASIYPGSDADGNALSFTLYADESGIVQYIRFAMQ